METSEEVLSSQGHGDKLTKDRAHCGEEGHQVDLQKVLRSPRYIRLDVRRPSCPGSREGVADFQDFVPKL